MASRKRSRSPSRRIDPIASAPYFIRVDKPAVEGDLALTVNYQLPVCVSFEIKPDAELAFGMPPYQGPSAAFANSTDLPIEILAMVRKVSGLTEKFKLSPDPGAALLCTLDGSTGASFSWKARSSVAGREITQTVKIALPQMGRPS